MKNNKTPTLVNGGSSPSLPPFRLYNIGIPKMDNNNRTFKDLMAEAFDGLISKTALNPMAIDFL